MNNAIILTTGKKEWFEEWENEKCMKRGDDYDGFKKQINVIICCWNRIWLSNKIFLEWEYIFFAIKEESIFIAIIDFVNVIYFLFITFRVNFTIT